MECTCLFSWNMHSVNNVAIFVCVIKRLKREISKICICLFHLTLTDHQKRFTFISKYKYTIEIVHRNKKNRIKSKTITSKEILHGKTYCFRKSYTGLLILSSPLELWNISDMFCWNWDNLEVSSCWCDVITTNYFHDKYFSWLKRFSEDIIFKNQFPPEIYHRRNRVWQLCIYPPPSSHV